MESKESPVMSGLDVKLSMLVAEYQSADAIILRYIDTLEKRIEKLELKLRCLSES